MDPWVLLYVQLQNGGHFVRREGTTTEAQCHVNKVAKDQMKQARNVYYVCVHKQLVDVALATLLKQ